MPDFYVLQDRRKTKPDIFIGCTVVGVERFLRYDEYRKMYCPEGIKTIEEVVKYLRKSQTKPISLDESKRREADFIAEKIKREIETMEEDTSKTLQVNAHALVELLGSLN